MALLAFLVALVLFVLASLSAGPAHSVAWGLASTVLGLILSGLGFQKTFPGQR
jgi:hypothetical protein